MQVLATLGSHSALNILCGAKEIGFKTLLLCKRKTDFYEKFKLADEIIYLDDFSEISKLQDELVKKNSIVIPHGSFISYLDLDFLENDFKVPIFGNKKAFRWESDRELEKKWLKKAKLKTPKTFSPDEIDRPVIVKLFGAHGGRGYFLCKSSKEFYERIGDRKCQIQEYVVGVPMYFHYFYSKLQKELELESIDRRYEANVDSIYRYEDVEKTYSVVGNFPIAVRESLLQKVFEMGEGVVFSSNKLFGGLWGPFCLETIVTDSLDIFVFEISARIVAGTNLFVPYSPYSYFKFREKMYAGKRIALEIKKAIEEERIEEVLT